MPSRFRLALVSICVLPILAAHGERKPLVFSKAVTLKIRNLAGQSVGTATLSEAQPHGVKLVLNITNLPPGKHDFHIHEKALCEAGSEFNTAGLQYDPTGDFYGNDQHIAHRGPAAGNPGQVVEIAGDGTGYASVVFANLTLGNDDHSVFANGGTAIILHAAAGADGPMRIACGVINPQKAPHSHRR